MYTLDREHLNKPVHVNRTSTLITLFFYEKPMESVKFYSTNAIDIGIILQLPCLERPFFATCYQQAGFSNAVTQGTFLHET